jgi:hypothetical protein
MPDFDEVDFVNSEDQKYYTISVQVLGEATSLYKEMANQYQLLIDLIGEYKPGKSTIAEDLKQFHANIIFLLSCKYQFVTAVLNILRGHLGSITSFSGRNAHRPRANLIAYKARIHDHTYHCRLRTGCRA